MHDLWIFPAPRASRWFARLDWYLNWQMCKGVSYAGLHLPEETYRVAETHGHALRVENLDQPPLLVLPGARVPTKKCLVLDDFDAPLETWFGALAAHALSLRARTARIFLPTGRSLAEAEAAWARIHSDLDVSFATDLDTPK
jgi:hypothetical protein